MHLINACFFATACMSRASFSPVCACAADDALGTRVAVLPEFFRHPRRQGRCYPHSWYFVELLPCGKHARQRVHAQCMCVPRTVRLCIGLAAWTSTSVAIPPPVRCASTSTSVAIPPQVRCVHLLPQHARQRICSRFLAFFFNINFIYNFFD